MVEIISVAMIIQDDFSRVGGAQSQLAGLIPHLRANNVEISILTRRPPGFRAYEKLDGVQIFRLPTFGLKPLTSAFYSLLAQPILKRLRPDLIHAHGVMSPATTGLLAKQFFGIPVIAKVLRGGVAGDLHRIREKILSKLRIAWLQKNIDCFLAISDEIDHELQEIGIQSERRIRLPNGVDTKKFTPLSQDEKGKLRQDFGYPEAGILCVYSGRLVAEKNVDLLIRVFNQIHVQHPEALLLILGSGDQELALRQIAGPGVNFVGFTDQVASYLQMADMFVLPSETEGLSNAMLEAMAAGLAVISTAVGGAPDVIKHGETGWLVTKGDAVSLKNGIEQLVEDQKLRHSIGSNARKKMIAEYDFPVVARQLRDVYESILTY